MLPALFTANAGGLESKPPNTSVSVQTLVKERQENVAALLKIYPSITKDCGQPNWDYHGVEILLPVGRADEFYISESGIQLYIQVVNHQPKRQWCGLYAGLEGQPVSSAGKNTFVSFMQNNLSGKAPLTYASQRGRLPIYVGRLDSYSLLGIQSGQSLVSETGQQKCFAVVKEGLGISWPIITEPLRCAE
ncbi:hypothetical protein [Deinococcus sp.]|uniref:hypothetical protein n=1 Tax=Deinococcus sp. TaxID=47478 RepID=UPI003B5BA53D